jgi:ATP-dependent Clp protease ATP-binding subunit ClpC
MFERFSEEAKRVMFFARYEASRCRSPFIEGEHLLLGLLREDRNLTNRILQTHPIGELESIQNQIEAHRPISEKTPASVDPPLSHECKRVLAYAAEEAEQRRHKPIGMEHLLLGLLREEKCFAARILHARGLRISPLRNEPLQP